MYLTTGTELGFFTKRGGVEGAGIPSSTERALYIDGIP